MTIRYDEVLGPLRAAYDGGASWRDGLDKEQWKLTERQAFRDRLTAGTRLLEIGAGTGQDSSYFQREGFGVVAADLSAAMVERCRAKGIEAHVMDFLQLAVVRSILRPGGLFFVGVYAGEQSEEGPLDDDRHVPPRFFSWRTDERLLGFAADARFDVVDFHSVDTDRGYRFQSLTLRRPDGE